LDAPVSSVPNDDGAEDPAQALVHEIFDLSVAIDLIGQATAGRLGVNQTDLICLELLHRRGPMGAGEVASALGLTTAAISAMATRLEAGGYARREMDPKDRRRVLLHASPSGLEKAYGLFTGLYEAAERLTADYAERDLRMLVALLGRFRQLITEHTTVLRDGAPRLHGDD
jgi:DNA-binding MarR family transcriptional regulator